MTKFTEKDLDAAVVDLAMCEFFPKESQASIKLLLARMCPHREALRWLVSEVVNHVGKWPGPAELRGLLCTRYDAADGIDQWCTLPGYSAADSERKTLEEHEQRKIQERVGGSVSGESREMIRQLTAPKKQNKAVA